jgi:hypothetical protein
MWRDVAIDAAEKQKSNLYDPIKMSALFDATSPSSIYLGIPYIRISQILSAAVRSSRLNAQTGLREQENMRPKFSMTK